MAIDRLDKPKVLVITSSGSVGWTPWPCFFDHPSVRTFYLTPLSKIPGRMPKKRIRNVEITIAASLRVPRLYLLSYMILGIFSAAAIIRKEKIPIVHAHGPISFFIAFFGSKVAHRKVVIDFHYFEPSPGLLEVYQGKWRQNDFRLKISELLLKFAGKWSDFIITSTPRLKESLVKRGIETKKIGIILNSINTEEITPQRPDDHIRDKLGLGQEDKVVMFVGTFHGLSGDSFLLEAAALVKDKRVRFVMVGDGPDRPRLEKLCHRLGLDSRVIFTGIIPPSKVAPFLAIADLCVSPSLGKYYDETGFIPGKTLAYMAAGKPALLCASKQARELLDGGACLVAMGNNPKLYARAIENALSNPKRLQSIGETARRNVELYRDRKKNQARYLRIHRAALTYYARNPRPED